MGKNKRLKSSSKKIKGGRGPGKPKPSGISKPSSKTQKPSSGMPTKKHKQTHHNIPIIPFSPRDSILLIGDGDLSFARSLIAHHEVKKLTATVFESSLQILQEKYPQVGENIKEIEEGGGIVKYGVDATKMRAWTTAKGGRGDGVMDRIFLIFRMWVGRGVGKKKKEESSDDESEVEGEGEDEDMKEDFEADDGEFEQGRGERDDVSGLDDDQDEEDEFNGVSGDEDEPLNQDWTETR
ncbi:25S rRNA (uridine-N(3))-methyltransferase [Botrytis cinerea]